MLLTHRDVMRIAKLARIAMADDEVNALRSELDSIFSLIERMQTINTDSVTPLAHPQDIPLRLRDDIVTESNQRDSFQAIAPQVEAGMFVVPKVIE